MKKLFTYITLTIVIALAIFYMSTLFLKVEAGVTAPGFDAELIDGTAFKLSQLKGKYVLLDFWGSWCAPCRKENRQLVKLHERYEDELFIVTVALEKDSLTWKKIADIDGFSWKHQIVTYNNFVLLSPIARKYSVTEIPAKFLIDPQGKIVGELDFNQIDSLLTRVKGNTFRLLK